MKKLLRAKIKRALLEQVAGIEKIIFAGSGFLEVKMAKDGIFREWAEEVMSVIGRFGISDIVLLGA